MYVMGVPLPLAVLLATLAGALLGAAQERLTLAPVRDSPQFIQVTITLGVAVMLRGIALIFFGKDPMCLPGFSGNGIFFLFDAILPVQRLWVWGATALMLRRCSGSSSTPTPAAPCAPARSILWRRA